MLDRPRALPGGARDAARGDAGQRAGRDRLPPRGPGRRRASGPVVVNGLYPELDGPRRRPGGGGRGRGRVACAPGEAEALRGRGRVPAATAPALQGEQVDRLADAAAAAPAAPAVPVQRRARARPRSTVLADAAARRASTRSPSCRRDRADVTPAPTDGAGRARRPSARSSCAAARAASARRRPPRCSRWRRPGRAGGPCVVTIDPAKRLADALGLDGADRTTPSRIDGDWPGELWALMLDTKSTFDDLVATLRRRRPSRPSASSPTASTATSPAPCRARRSTWRWRSSTSCTTRRDFDLVVVDTPPTRNALDFLDAPAAAHPLPRPPPLPDADGADRGHREGGERGRPGVPAHGVEGRRRRGARRRHRVLPGLRGHGGGLQASGPTRVHALLADRRTAFVLVASPAARHGRGGAASSPTSSAEAGIAGAGAGREPDAPAVRRRRCPRRPASGPRTLDGTDLGGLYANLADFRLVAAREEEHLAGLADAGGARAGGAGAVPAHRRPRPRRPGRGRRPPLPATRPIAGRCRSSGRHGRASSGSRRRRRGEGVAAASTVSVTGTMRSKPVVWSRRVSVGRLQATATSPPASRARRMPPMRAPRPAESMNGTAERSMSRRRASASSASASRNWPTV